MEKKYKWAVKVDGSGCSGPCRRDTCCWTVCVFEKKAWRVTWCGAGSRGAEQGSRENGVEAAIQSADEVFTMGDNLVVCDIDEDVITKINKLRFRKETTNAALVMKVEKQRKTVVLDEEFEDISVEDLKDELPERQPRFVLYSYKYKHDDGRCSFPLCFIFISPQGCKPDLQMMYAGTKNNLVRSAQLTKVFELRSTEEFTESWLKEKLGFFR